MKIEKNDDSCPMGKVRVSGAQTLLFQVCLKQSHLLVEDTEQHGHGPVMLISQSSLFEDSILPAFQEDMLRTQYCFSHVFLSVGLDRTGCEIYREQGDPCLTDLRDCSLVPLSSCVGLRD